MKPIAIYDPYDASTNSYILLIQEEPENYWVAVHMKTGCASSHNDIIKALEGLRDMMVRLKALDEEHGETAFFRCPGATKEDWNIYHSVVATINGGFGKYFDKSLERFFKKVIKAVKSHQRLIYIGDIFGKIANYFKIK